MKTINNTLLNTLLLVRMYNRHQTQKSGSLSFLAKSKLLSCQVRIHQIVEFG